MPQHKEDSLNDFNFLEKLELQGSLRILLEEKGFPIVFLIDENHDNLNNCIDKNVKNAIALIAKAKVDIVGVECFAGGKSWDSEKMEYSDNYFNKKLDDRYAESYKSSNIKFSDGLKLKFNNYIFGVESFGMVHRMGEDFAIGGKYYGTDVSAHPLNNERSKHFIRTLFEHHHDNNLKGNLILNCGIHHNRDIENWIEKKEIEKIANQKASYIRLNTID